MKSVFSKVAVALFPLIAIFSSASNAGIITEDLGVWGMKTSPGNITWNFTAPSGHAELEFELVGAKSLDGYSNCCSDIFHLALNGAEIFRGSFNMGGGGLNTILFNPNGGTSLTTTYGATGDVHNSQQVTFAGGLTQIMLPLHLLLGPNQLNFSYTGIGQGAHDELWGVKIATITTKTLPESASYILLLVGLAGIVTLRRRSL